MAGNLLPMSGVKRAAVVFLVVFLVFLEAVSSVLHVYAPLGHEVLLPCVCSEQHRLPETVNVHWKDRGDRVLLEIIDSSLYEGAQDQTFRGRVQTFPELYREGNFSVLLRNVQMSDSSCYDCYIPQLRLKETVHLTVSDQRVSEPRTSPPGPSSGDARLTAGCLHLTMSLALLTFLLFKPS